MTKTRFYVWGTALTAMVLLVGVWVRAPRIANAATTITVNSTADNQANDGSCTLREAIIAANNDTASGGASGECAAGSGTDTINFAITGSADYAVTDRNNTSKNGYTIDITSNLPDITETVIINGYSQPGALTNTAIAPQPLNGALLIQLDGGHSTSGVFMFRSGSEDSVLSGVVISNFAGNPVSMLQTSGIHVTGNYFGTDPTGLIAQGNGGATTTDCDGVAISVGQTGFPATDTAVTDIVLGGLSPADRNVVAGNNGGGIHVGNVRTTIQGNIVGLGADGSTVLGNTAAVGPDCVTGAITIDYAQDVLLGGASEGAANIISGNQRSVQPVDTDGLVIQGNLIGTDYTGEVAKPNLYNGIVLAGGSNTLIGGTQPGEGNIIAYNFGSAVGVADFSIPLYSVEFNAIGISILGNSIHSQQPVTTPVITPATGIDLVEAIETTNPPGGEPESYLEVGTTVNDLGDVDTGPNNYINFPVLNSAKQTGTSLALNYDLDAADSPSDEYRVEFFASDVANTSGYGEGQTFLGAVTAGNGDGNAATLTLPSGTDLTGKVISATTTVVDDDTDSGFGSTSEFSAVLGAEVIATDTSNPITTSPVTASGGSLGETGQRVLSRLALVVILASSTLGVVRALRKKHSYKV